MRGIPFALTPALEHELPKTVKRDPSPAQADLEKAHRDAGRVANWLL